MDESTKEVAGRMKQRSGTAKQQLPSSPRVRRPFPGLRRSAGPLSAIRGRPRLCSSGRAGLDDTDELPNVLRPGFDVQQDLVIVSERVRRELGFSERHSREEALRKTVEWQSLSLGQPSAMSAVYRAEDRVLERRR